MNGCTKGPQLEEGENLNTEAPGTGRTPPGGTSAPVEQTQRGPSPVFVMENIDVLRTMIKELDNRGQEKGPQLEEGENLNTGAPGTRRTPPGGTSAPIEQTQRGPSPVFVKENIDVLRTMIKELDNRGQEKVPPRNLFNEESGVAGSENSQMSPSAEEAEGYSSDGSSRSRSRVWCKMFRQTLSGSARNWFDSLDPKSVDGFEELSNKFLEEFSQQKSTHIKGVPPMLRIFAFMHGHGHPDLSKKLNDEIPKTVDEMWGRVKAFIRGEITADTTEVIRSPWGEGRSMGTCAPYARREGFTPLTNTPNETLTMDNVNFPPPPPMVGTLEKRNMNKLCDYHQDRGHNTNDCYHLKKHFEEVVASGRLAHLVKDIRQGGQKSKGSTKGNEKVINMVRSQGYQKRPYERVEHWMDNAITFPSSLSVVDIVAIPFEVINFIIEWIVEARALKLLIPVLPSRALYEDGLLTT
nr:reverse transcriptase domain-containing protein [Tanacetum cinerariifolium]